MKQSRIQTFHLRKRETRKDDQGVTFVDYGEPVKFSGEVWPAGGKVQAEMYGERLSYIRNMKIEGEYTVRVDEKNRLHYVFSKKLDVSESDGVCIYVPGESKPDYKIISIKPCRPLRLECEKL